MGVLRRKCLVVICCLAFLALQEVQARPGASEENEVSNGTDNNEGLEQPHRPQPNNSSGNCSCQTQPTCDRNNECGCNMQIRNSQCQPVIVTECPTTCRPRSPKPSCDNGDRQNNQNHFSRPPEKCEEEPPKRQKNCRKPPKEECSEEEKEVRRKKRRRKKPSSEPSHPPCPRPIPHECECDDSRERECPKNECVPRPCRPVPSCMSYRGFESCGSYEPIGKVFGWRLIKFIGKIAYLKKTVASIVLGKHDCRSRPASCHSPRRPSSSDNECQEESGMVHLMRFIQSNTGREMMKIVMSGLIGG